jgi:tetratricopeptide (TPR) repeat protein
MGGLGKSQLAFVVAQRLRDRYPKQILVALQGATEQPVSPEQALQTVIQHFEPTAKLPDDLPTLIGVYQGCLEQHRQQTGEALLILADDARDRQQVEPLMPPAGCALLTTSRTAFDLPRMQRLDLGTLSPAEAEQLLLDICPRIAEHAPELAKLCGYLPLALRVSATLLQEQDDYPVAEYLADLGKAQLELLSDPDYPDDPSRSVAASLLLSYQHLAPDAQQTFQQTGVFVGSFTREALVAVIDGVADAAKQVRELRRRSLLDYDAASERYDLHDLVRACALTKLADERPARLRHARYYMQVAYYAHYELYLKGKQLEGLTLFDRERRQTDAAWDWLLNEAPSDDTDRLLLGLANATVYIGDVRYDLRREEIPYREAQAAAARRLGERQQEGRALGNLGNAYTNLGEAHCGIDYYQQWLAIAREIGDRRSEGTSLGNLGLAYYYLGEARRAIELYEQHLAIAREIGDRRGEGNALGNLGLAYADLGEVPRAIEYHEQALVISREIGDRRAEGQDLGNLGITYADLGEARRAIEYHEQDLAIRREIGDRRGEGNALEGLGLAYADLGEVPRAIEYHEQRLAIAREIGDRRGEGYALGNLGNAYKNLGETEQAQAQYEQSLAVKQAIGDAAGVARTSWKLGEIFEQQGDLARAAALMQVYVDFLRQIGHADAEQDAARLEEVKRKLAHEQHWNKNRR